MDIFKWATAGLFLQRKISITFKTLHLEYKFWQDIKYSRRGNSDTCSDWAGLHEQV